MKKISFFIAFTVAIILCSCKHDPPPEVDPPVITVNDPPGSVLYHNSDTIFINADLSDENSLHEAFICVRDSVDTMFSYDPYVHELLSFQVDTFWVVSGISTLTPGFVSFSAENHHEKTTVMNVPVYFTP